MREADAKAELVFQEGPFDGEEMEVQLPSGRPPSWLFIMLGQTSSCLVHDYELVTRDVCESCGRHVFTYAYFGARVGEPSFLDDLEE